MYRVIMDESSPTYYSSFQVCCFPLFLSSSLVKLDIFALKHQVSSVVEAGVSFSFSPDCGKEDEPLCAGVSIYINSCTKDMCTTQNKYPDATSYHFHKTVVDKLATIFIPEEHSK